MDYRSILSVSENPNEKNIPVDQAVFTSLPTFTSEGYRLIAASPGIRPDEKIEITRNCPSHKGLCSESPDAVGLSSYRLKSGRHCIAYSCYAGREHTARGGERVYTHLVVLDRETYRKFEFNPLFIHRIIGQTVGELPNLKPDSRLEQFTLQLPNKRESIREISCNIDNILVIASALLNRQRLIATGGVDSHRLLDWVLQTLSFPTREALSVSIGLNFSPARKFQLTFLDHDDAQAKHLIRGQNILWLDLLEPSSIPASSYVGWLDHVRRWWKENRFDRIRNLGSHLDFDASPEKLDRIAAICEDIDRLDSSEQDSLNNLRSKYERLQPINDAEVYLVHELQNQLTERMARLENEHTPTE